MRSLVSAVVCGTRLLALIMQLALAERSAAPSATAKRAGSAKPIRAGLAARRMSEICQSCQEERSLKKPPLPPMERIELPAGVTDARNFRRPEQPTYVCPYCDGETLVSRALHSFQERQGA